MIGGAATAIFQQRSRLLGETVPWSRTQTQSSNEDESNEVRTREDDRRGRYGQYGAGRDGWIVWIGGW